MCNNLIIVCIFVLCSITFISNLQFHFKVNKIRQVETPLSRWRPQAGYSQPRSTYATSARLL